MAFASKGLIDAASDLRNGSIIRPAVMIIALVILDIVITAWNSYLTIRSSESLSNSMCENLFGLISRTKWLNISRYHSDDIMTRLTSDVDIVVNTVMSTLPSVISLSILLVTSFISLFIFDPILAVLAFLLGPVSVLLGRFYTKKIGILYGEAQEAEAISRGFIHEALQNIIVIKAFRLEKRSLSTVCKLQNDKLKLVVQRNKLSIFSNILLSLGYWAGYFLAFGWGTYRLTEGMITFGTLVAFLQLVGNVQSPFSGLAGAFPQVISCAASAKRLIEIEALRQENYEGTAPKWDKCGIKLENVSFGYDNDKPILKDISFEIKPGEMVCLMGPSGEGKTTVLRLIMALLEPDGGHIYLKDEDGAAITAEASGRTLISYVPQGNTLFSGTIADNMRSGDENASDAELEAAACSAEALSFIKKLDDGLNTEIGERGTGLSEGQAQRIAIARALLNKTPILLLDEATSSLDVRAEKEILKSIKSQNPARTCIVVTHRISAAEMCDRILMLEDGKIRTFASSF